MAALHSIQRIGIATRGIFHHLDPELRFDVLWGPGEENPKQSPIKQQRMRADCRLGQGRAIRAIDRRENRILSFTILPSLPERCRGYAHRVRRLVAGDAGAAVRAQRFEKSMALGVNGAGGIQNRSQSVGIIVFFGPWEIAALSGVPPDAIGAIRTAALRRRNGSRKKDCGEEEGKFHAGSPPVEFRPDILCPLPGMRSRQPFRLIVA